MRITAGLRGPPLPSDPCVDRGGGRSRAWGQAASAPGPLLPRSRARQWAGRPPEAGTQDLEGQPPARTSSGSGPQAAELDHTAPCVPSLPCPAEPRAGGRGSARLARGAQGAARAGGGRAGCGQRGCGAGRSVPPRPSPEVLGAGGTPQDLFAAERAEAQLPAFPLRAPAGTREGCRRPPGHWKWQGPRAGSTGQSRMGTSVSAGGGGPRELCCPVARPRGRLGPRSQGRLRG